MADLDQSAVCPAWMIPYSESASNLKYNVEQMTFKFELPFDGELKTKDVTLGYPILEGEDLYCFALFPDNDTSKKPTVKLLRSLLLQECTIV